MKNFPNRMNVAELIYFGVIGLLIVRQILVQEGFVISNLSSDVWVAIAAAMIALCALGVSIQQSRSSIRHNKLSVRPKLTLEYAKLDGAPKIGLSLTNTGLGPAIINKIVIKRTGLSYECNTEKFIKFLPVQQTRNQKGELVSTNVEVGFSFSCIGTGTTLEVGKSIWLIWHDSPTPLQRSYWEVALLGVDIDAIYESMYGEEFSINLGSIKFTD